MPIYEYECRVCGARFERLVDGPGARPRCPKATCRSRAVRRLLSLPQPPIVAKSLGETYPRKKAPPGYDHFRGGTN